MHVFVSYKSEDRDRLRPLVAAIEAEGIEVWWDPRIKGGSAWRETIEEQLRSAGCVVVAWSERSAGPQGRFVRDEAAWAQERGVYLPIVLDAAVRLPIGFGEVQALPLVGWKGDPADPRFHAVLAAVREMLGRSPLPPPTHSRRPRLDRRRLIAGGAVLAIGAAVGGGWMIFGSRGKAKDGVAVLPFVDLSGDTTQAYFSEGLAEELRGALARVPSLKIVGRSSCEKVKDLPPDQVAAKLRVANVLTGSVRRSASLLRVSAQLVEGASGVELWSQTFDRPPGDALVIESSIAESVADALRIRLVPAEKASLRVGATANAQALDLLLRARAIDHTSHTEAAIRQSISLCEQALTLDPNFQRARLQLAYLLLWLTDVDSAAAAEADVARAEIEIRQVVAAAPDWANAHAVLASALSARFDFNDALAEIRRSQELPGAEPNTLCLQAVTLSLFGFDGEAQSTAARAIALGPLDAGSYYAQAVVDFSARRWPRAAEYSRRTLVVTPGFSEARSLLALCLVMMDQANQARAELAKLPPDDLPRLTAEAILDARTGNRAASDWALAQLQRMGGDRVSYQMAQVHAQRGESDLAFAALGNAWKFKASGLLCVPTDAFLDPIRSDPRFAALLKKLNVPMPGA